MGFRIWYTILALVCVCLVSSFLQLYLNNWFACRIWNLNNGCVSIGAFAMTPHPIPFWVNVEHSLHFRIPGGYCMLLWSFHSQESTTRGSCFYNFCDQGEHAEVLCITKNFPNNPHCTLSRSKTYLISRTCTYISWIKGKEKLESPTEARFQP